MRSHRLAALLTTTLLLGCTRAEPQRRAPPPRLRETVAWQVLRDAEVFGESAVGTSGDCPEEVHALRMLCQRADAEAALLALSREGSLVGRCYAAFGLRGIGSPAATALGERLAAEGGKVDYHAGCFGWSKTVAQLIASLDDPDFVRGLMVSRRESAPFPVELAELRRDEPLEAAWRVAASLPGARSDWLRLARSADPADRALALVAIGRVPPGVALAEREVLVAGLHDPDPSVRMAALTAIGELRPWLCNFADALEPWLFSTELTLPPRVDDKDAFGPEQRALLGDLLVPDEVRWSLWSVLSRLDPSFRLSLELATSARSESVRREALRAVMEEDPRLLRLLDATERAQLRGLARSLIEVRREGGEWNESRWLGGQVLGALQRLGLNVSGEVERLRVILREVLIAERDPEAEAPPEAELEAELEKLVEAHLSWE